MGTSGETRPEEIARPSCRLCLDGPRAQRRPHPAMWHWLLGSHKQMVGQVCTVGIPSCHHWVAMGCWCFPLPHPLPWPRCHIQAQGSSRVPTGQVGGPPHCHQAFKEGVKPQWHGQRDTWSANTHWQARRKPELQLSMS